MIQDCSNQLIFFTSISLRDCSFQPGSVFAAKKQHIHIHNKVTLLSIVSKAHMFFLWSPVIAVVVAFGATPHGRIEVITKISNAATFSHADVNVSINRLSEWNPSMRSIQPSQG